MSSGSSLDLIVELKDIRASLLGLLQRVDSVLERAEAASPGPSSELDWELVEDRTNPPGVADLSRPFPGSKFVGAATAPPATPDFVLDIAKLKLHSSTVPSVDRARRAFLSGHYAWAAIETCTPFSPEPHIHPLQSVLGIVLRGPGLRSPVRVSTKKDSRAVVKGSDETLVCEEFASLTE